MKSMDVIFGPFKRKNGVFSGFLRTLQMVHDVIYLLENLRLYTLCCNIGIGKVRVTELATYSIRVCTRGVGGGRDTN